MLAELLTIMAPVLICVGIGFGWARFEHHFDPELVTLLVTSVGAPCLVFYTLTHLTVSIEAFATMAGATLAMLAVCAAAGALLLRLFKLSQRAFLPILVFPNTGNMGLPLSLLAFGDVGLALAIAVFTTFTVVHLTFGVAIASGSLHLGRLARVPLLYAVPPALFFMFAGVTVPKWIEATTHLLAGMTIPLMLITLGVSLGRLRVPRFGLSLGLSLLRVGLGFVSAIGLAALFDLDATARSVLILQGTMPAAVFNYLFAQRYQTAPEEVAGVVVLSTLLSFVSLPVLLAWLL